VKLPAAIALVVVAALPAAAQTTDSLPARRFEIDAGGGWLAGARLGSTDGNLRSPADAQAVFRLFSVDSRFAGAPTFHVRTAYAISPRFGLEAGLTFARPELRASVSNDAEAAPPITITERVDQYSIDAGVIIMIRELGLGGRTWPFVAAGAGYLRQLHEGHSVIDHGRFLHAGGGIKHWMLVRNGGFISGAGLRADARLYVMSGGIAFDEDPRPHAAISGSAFVTF
jgi:hypothetical protein